MTTPRPDFRRPPPGRFGGIGGLFGGMGGRMGGYNPFMGGGFNPYQQQRNPFMGGGFNPYQQQRNPFMGGGMGGFNPYQQRMPFMGGGFNPYQQQRNPFMGGGMGGFNPYQQRMPFMGGGFNPYMGGGFNPYQQQQDPQAPPSISDLYGGLDEEQKNAFLQQYGLGALPTTPDEAPISAVEPDLDSGTDGSLRFEQNGEQPTMPGLNPDVPSLTGIPGIDDYNQQLATPPGQFDPGPGMPDGLTMGTMGGPGYGEYPLGTAGPRVDPSDPNYIPPPSDGGGFIPQFPPGVEEPPFMAYPGGSKGFYDRPENQGVPFTGPKVDGRPPRPPFGPGHPLFDPKREDRGPTPMEPDFDPNIMTPPAFDRFGGGRTQSGLSNMGFPEIPPTIAPVMPPIPRGGMLPGQGLDDIRIPEPVGPPPFDPTFEQMTGGGGFPPELLPPGNSSSGGGFPPELLPTSDPNYRPIDIPPDEPPDIMPGTGRGVKIPMEPNFDPNIMTPMPPPPAFDRFGGGRTQSGLSNMGFPEQEALLERKISGFSPSKQEMIRIEQLPENEREDALRAKKIRDRLAEQEQIGGGGQILPPSIMPSPMPPPPAPALGSISTNENGHTADQIRDMIVGITPMPEGVNYTMVDAQRLQAQDAAQMQTPIPQVPTPTPRVPTPTPRVPAPMPRVPAPGPRLPTPPQFIPGPKVLPGPRTPQPMPPTPVAPEPAPRPRPPVKGLPIPGPRTPRIIKSTPTPIRPPQAPIRPMPQPIGPRPIPPEMPPIGLYPMPDPRFLKKPPTPSRGIKAIPRPGARRRGGR